MVILARESSKQTVDRANDRSAITARSRRFDSPTVPLCCPDKRESRPAGLIARIGRNDRDSDARPTTPPRPAGPAVSSVRSFIGGGEVIARRKDEISRVLNSIGVNQNDRGGKLKINLGLIRTASGEGVGGQKVIVRRVSQCA